MWGFCVQSLFCGVVLSLLHLAEEESRWLLGIIVFLLSHARIQNFLPEGAQLWQLFFFFFFFFFFSWWDERGSKYHNMRANIVPPVKRVSLACRWWPNIEFWLGSFVLFRESGQVLPWNPIYVWFFRGGGGPDPLPPSWDAHAVVRCRVGLSYVIVAF